MTTPQDIALLDARRGIEMFRRWGTCSRRDREYVTTPLFKMWSLTEKIFGEGGGAKLRQNKIPNCRALYLDLDIRQNGR